MPILMRRDRPLRPTYHAKQLPSGLDFDDDTIFIIKFFGDTICANWCHLPFVLCILICHLDFTSLTTIIHDSPRSVVGAVGASGVCEASTKVGL
jgi:hypothetical protein